jgi:hypothetical protein
MRQTVRNVGAQNRGGEEGGWASRENQAVQEIADKKIECGTNFASRRSRARSRFFAIPS